MPSTIGKWNSQFVVVHVLPPKQLLSLFNCFAVNPRQLGTLTIGGEITVWLLSSITGLDQARKFDLYFCTEIPETRDQSYKDFSA